MKAIFTILSILINISILAQPYTNNDKLLTSKRYDSWYIVMNDSIAYYDFWGGKKYITYFLIDTLKKENDSSFKGTSHTLNKQGNSWILRGNNTSKTITFNDADNAEYNNWTSLLNWIRYLDVAKVIEKYEHTNEAVYIKMRQDLLQLGRIASFGNKPKESIDGYKLLLTNLCKKHNNYIASVPLYYFKPWPYTESLIGSTYRSKK